jgi:hypothetical protein
MSLPPQQAEGPGTDAPRRSLSVRLLEKLRTHIRTWPERQVEMQVEAISGEK